MKAMKLIIGTLVTVVLLTSIIAAYILFTIDPNTYKPQLIELAKEQNIVLNIEGDISWQLLPTLSLAIGRTKITSPRIDIPEINFKQADLSLAWLPLLSRQLSINAIRLDGADIRLSTAKESANTAIAPLAAAKANATDTTPGTTPAFKLAIERLEITNSRLRLPQPPTAETPSARQLSDINLLIQGLNLDGKVFKFQASFHYNDPALTESMAVKLSSEATVTQATQSITASQAMLEFSLGDKPTINISFPTLTADQTGQLEIPQLLLSSAEAILQASLSAQTLNDKATFESELNVPPMALGKVLSSWEIELPDFPDKQALQQASLKLSIKGSDDALIIRSLNLTLDDIKINGNAELSFAPTRSVALKLNGNTIDLTPYIGSTEISSTEEIITSGNGKNSATTKHLNNEPVLIFAPLIAPLLWVGEVNATLGINLDALTVDNITTEKLQIKLEAENNIVQVKQLSAHIFDGDIDATATVNLQHKDTKVNFATSINGLSLGKALIAVNGKTDLLGSLTAQLQGSTYGNDAEQLHQQLTGSGEISLANPHISAFNIEQSYCDIAALIEKIPNKTDWPQGSNLQDAQASLSLKGKQIYIERYTTGLGNISLSGKGIIDLGEENFDLLAISRLNGERTSEQGCLVKSKRVRDKDIPIRCKDSFANASGGSCKPDGDFVKQVLQDKLFEQIQKKSGLNEESEEALKGLLKGLFGR